MVSTKIKKIKIDFIYFLVIFYCLILYLLGEYYNENKFYFAILIILIILIPYYFNFNPFTLTKKE